MKVKSLLSLGMLLTASLAISQTQSEVAEIKQLQNTNKLEILSQATDKLEAKKLEIIKKANQKGLEINQIINGKLHTIVDFYQGKPVYQTAHNIDASISTRANFLWQGGNMGLNIEGQNMIVGVWDEQRVKDDHVEFMNGSGSRIILGDSNIFNEDEFGDHGTHVGGTIAAAGVNEDAKGAAPQSTIVTYTWDQDFNEVQDEANDNGLLISNHSYGVPVFNNNGSANAPTWMMGNYSSQARAWDLLSNTFPYYLMVVSAGNDGGSNYSGGLKNGFDKLTHEKNGKNNLIVGNAQDASVDAQSGELTFPAFINSSSSQGPTDDGRIKPDVVGNGTNVISPVTTSQSSYATFSGTSMAAPNVAGTLILLQQYYNQEKGNYMLSSTLKALAIHTADDLGNTGPDAKYGWGLVNAKKAVELIQDTDTDVTRIEEIDLANQETFTFNVKKEISKDLEVTIVWNDPAGTSRDGILNDPTPVLVNDLDLRIKRVSNSETFLPWRLDLANVAANAVKDDNIVDNVENIIVDASDSEIYEVTISHKGNLNNPQKVSLIVSGVEYTTLATQDIEVDVSNINVWPNPVNNQLNITGTEAFEGQVQVNVYDISGRLVLSSDKDTASQNSIQMNTSSLTTGTYFVKITDGQTSLNKKIIKE
ncbi:S8 family serine peptidase [Psychroflexus halocasei]|uniref:Por secretion system C-terminal sorting domain-containing protein n=1 Tax=Psychroflexus halocasei TaxID=908615 RepID=A0A1H3VHZ0_9FLAO|nr:S8 family serine peptidase [Psychroflexus halocasei]SDZ74397.1 Por secretion system C-terminal sorting domain-containing protein [Psychroflexus halocasei]